MSLYHLIYQSQALTAFTLAQLKALLRQARAYNAAHGITGMLLHAPNGQFLHVMEGEKDAVQRLYYQSIATDPRHEHLTVLSEGPSAAKIFPDWCMSFRPGPEPLVLPGYVTPSTAFVRVCSLARTVPALKQLLLDFTAGYDDSPFAESMVGGKR